MIYSFCCFLKIQRNVIMLNWTSFIKIWPVSLFVSPPINFPKPPSRLGHISSVPIQSIYPCMYLNQPLNFHQDPPCLLLNQRPSGVTFNPSAQSDSEIDCLYACLPNSSHQVSSPILRYNTKLQGCTFVHVLCASRMST